MFDWDYNGFGRKIIRMLSLIEEVCILEVVIKIIFWLKGFFYLVSLLFFLEEISTDFLFFWKLIVNKK